MDTFCERIDNQSMQGFSTGRINVRNPAESIAIFRQDDKWLNSVHKYNTVYAIKLRKVKSTLRPETPFELLPWL